MKNISLILILFLTACGDSKETKIQRFLLQGNDMAGKLNYQEAKRYYSEALHIDSCFAEALNNLGTLYYKEKHYSEALPRYTKALECRPDFYDALLNRSNTYYELNDLTSALNDLDQYEKFKADTSVAFFLRGLINTKKHQYEQAIHNFHKAYSLDSTNTEIIINLGTVYYYKKDFDSARVILDQSRKRRPDEPNIFNTLALIETEKGNYKDAFEWISKALTLRPEDPYFLNNRGYLYLLMNELPKALADIDQSISEDPYNGWAYRNKGIYYLKINDIKSAIRLLERAEKEDPLIDKIFTLLGDAYLKSGDKKKACSYYQRALEQKELSPEQAEKMCR